MAMNKVRTSINRNGKYDNIPDQIQSTSIVTIVGHDTSNLKHFYFSILDNFIQPLISTG